MTLEMSGEIKTDLATEPLSVSFGDLSRREKGTQEFKVTVEEPEKVKITSVKSEDERFKVKLKSGSPTGNATYTVSFDGVEELGSISSKILFTVEGSETTTSELPVRARVVSNMRFPSSIFMLKSGPTFPPKVIEISHRAGKPIKIISATDAGGNLKIETTSVEKDKVKLTATVIDPTKSYDAPGQGDIIVKTSDPDDSELSIRYRISARKKTSMIRDRMRKSRKSDDHANKIMDDMNERLEKENKK